jgi:hypothetical protein
MSKRKMRGTKKMPLKDTVNKRTGQARALRWDGTQASYTHMLEFIGGPTKGHGQIKNDGTIDFVLYTKVGDLVVQPENWIVRELDGTLHFKSDYDYHILYAPAYKDHLKKNEPKDLYVDSHNLLNYIR